MPFCQVDTCETLSGMYHPHSTILTLVFKHDSEAFNRGGGIWIFRKFAVHF